MNDPAPLEITIRDSLVEDVPNLLDFLEPFFSTRQILSRTEEEMLSLVKHGFIAMHGLDIVGFAAIEVYSPKLAEIQGLAVSPAAQGQGIGKLLVSHCVQRAKQLGVFELMAITTSEKLFRDVGFDYSLPNQKRAFFYQTRPEK